MQFIVPTQRKDYLLNTNDQWVCVYVKLKLKNRIKIKIEKQFLFWNDTKTRRNSLLYCSFHIWIELYCLTCGASIKYIPEHKNRLITVEICLCAVSSVEFIISSWQDEWNQRSNIELNEVYLKREREIEKKKSRFAISLVFTENWRQIPW